MMSTLRLLVMSSMAKKLIERGLTLRFHIRHYVKLPGSRPPPVVPTLSTLTIDEAIELIKDVLFFQSTLLSTKKLEALRLAVNALRICRDQSIFIGDTLPRKGD